MSLVVVFKLHVFLLLAAELNKTKKIKVEQFWLSWVRGPDDLPPFDPHRASVTAWVL